MYALTVFDFNGSYSSCSSFLNLVSSSQFSKPIRKELDKNPSLIDARSPDNRTVWHYADSNDVLDFLWRKTPTTIDLQDDEGYTALQLAVLKRKQLKYKKLVSFNANQALTPKNGDTLLHTAARALDIAAINYFYNIEVASQINAEGLTFLDIILINQPRLRIISQLIRAGADLSSFEKDDINVFSDHYLTLTDEPYKLSLSKQWHGDVACKKGVCYVYPEENKFEINVKYLDAKGNERNFCLVDNDYINSVCTENVQDLSFNSTFADSVKEIKCESDQDRLDHKRKWVYDTLKKGLEPTNKLLVYIGSLISIHIRAEFPYEMGDVDSEELRYFKFIENHRSSPKTILTKFKELEPSDLKSLRDDQGNSLLHQTLRHKELDEVSLFLIESGCDVNVKNNFCRSPLFYALVNNQEGKNWKALLNKILVVSKKIESNIFKTFTDQRFFLEGSNAERVDTASQIILKGTANLAIQTVEKGLVPFDTMGLVGFMSNICNNKLLMSHVVKERKNISKAFLACKKAIKNDDVLDDVFKVFFELDAINFKDENENTLAHIAAANRNINALIMLFPYKPNLKSINSDGKVPLELMNFNTEETLSVINALLMEATKLADVEIIQDILNYSNVLGVSIHETKILDYLLSFASDANGTLSVNPLKSKLKINFASKGVYLDILRRLLVDTTIVLNLVERDASFFDYCSTDIGLDQKSTAHDVAIELLLSTVINQVLTREEQESVFRYLKKFICPAEEQSMIIQKPDVEYLFLHELYIDQDHILDIIEKKDDIIILMAILDIFPNLLEVDKENPFLKPIEANQKLVCFYLMAHEMYSTKENRRRAAEYIYEMRHRDINKGIIQLFQEELTTIEKEVENKNPNFLDSMPPDSMDTESSIYSFDSYNDAFLNTSVNIENETPTNLETSSNANITDAEAPFNLSIRASQENAPLNQQESEDPDNKRSLLGKRKFDDLDGSSQ